MKTSRDNKTFQMILIYTTREKEKKNKTKASGNIVSIDIVHHDGSFFDIQIIVDKIH
jgi:hypothetical protein